MTPEKRLDDECDGRSKGELEDRNIVMSYTTRKIGTGHVEALGDAWGTVKSMSGGVDSYLPEVFCRIDQLRALRKDRSPLQAMFGKAPTVPVPSCVEMPPGMPGIGVQSAIKPLRAGVYLYQHPTIVWLGLAAVFAVPFLAGYAVGRRKK